MANLSVKTVEHVNPVLHRKDIAVYALLDSMVTSAMKVRIMMYFFTKRA